MLSEDTEKNNMTLGLPARNTGYETGSECVTVYSAHVVSEPVAQLADS